MSWLGEWGWNRRTRWWRTGRARRSGDPEQVRDCSSKRWWCETSSPTPASSESGLSTRLGFFPPVWMPRKIEWKVFEKKNSKFHWILKYFWLVLFVWDNQSFSAVVGPNGSGKSNVIDAMLFVFGKRAKQVILFFFFFGSEFFGCFCLLVKIM